MRLVVVVHCGAVWCAVLCVRRVTAGLGLRLFCRRGMVGSWRLARESKIHLGGVSLPPCPPYTRSSCSLLLTLSLLFLLLHLYIAAPTHTPSLPCTDPIAAWIDAGMAEVRPQISNISYGASHSFVEDWRTHRVLDWLNLSYWKYIPTDERLLDVQVRFWMDGGALSFWRSTVQCCMCMAFIDVR